MPNNTRGKIREHLEGIHRNNEAAKSHCGKILSLIGDKNPTLQEGIEALAATYIYLDGCTQDVYVKL